MRSLGSNFHRLPPIAVCGVRCTVYGVGGHEPPAAAAAKTFALRRRSISSWVGENSSAFQPCARICVPVGVYLFSGLSVLVCAYGDQFGETIPIVDGCCACTRACHDGRQSRNQSKRGSDCLPCVVPSPPQATDNGGPTFQAQHRKSVRGGNQWVGHVCGLLHAGELLPHACVKTRCQKPPQREHVTSPQAGSLCLPVVGFRFTVCRGSMKTIGCCRCCTHHLDPSVLKARRALPLLQLCSCAKRHCTGAQQQKQNC